LRPVAPCRHRPTVAEQQHRAVGLQGHPADLAALVTQAVFLSGRVIFMVDSLNEYCIKAAANPNDLLR